MRSPVGEQEEEPVALLMPERRYELRAVECMSKTHASPNQTKSQHGEGSLVHTQSAPPLVEGLLLMIAVGKGRGSL